MHQQHHHLQYKDLAGLYSHIKCTINILCYTHALLRWQSSSSPTQLIVFVKQAYLRIITSDDGLVKYAINQLAHNQ